jgi:hypothetical protein
MQHVACLQTARRSDGLKDAGNGSELVAAGEGPYVWRRETDIFEGPASADQLAVLVDVVKFMESPKVAVPSLVRLGRVDGVLLDSFAWLDVAGYVATGSPSWGSTWWSRRQ